MRINRAQTNRIDGRTESPSFEDAGQVGLGRAQSRVMLRSVYYRVMDAAGDHLGAARTVELKDVALQYYRVEFTHLPQPVKRKLVQLKCSALDLPDAPDVPGLLQFIGSLGDQNLYLIEHPAFVFLAHRGRLLAYCKP